MSEGELEIIFERLRLCEINKNNMNAEQLCGVVQSAVSAPLREQKREFEIQIENLGKQFSPMNSDKPVEIYNAAQIVPGVKCEESLDVVKSLPEFDGQQNNYVSWRQAAHTAYKVFEKFEGSSKHYQSLAIIRNKIRGPADGVLASFGTVLNFKAMIARLDFTYSDKRSIYIIEQGMSTLQQGNLSVLKFFDEVEKKLTLLTNKTVMTNDRNLAFTINEKYRSDALRVFISGLKKPLCDILFASRPKDLPSALALAQEVESNHARYVFPTTFASRNEERPIQNGVRLNYGSQQNNPYYYRNRESPRTFNPANKPDEVKPMDVDLSVPYVRRSTNFRNFDGRNNRSQQFRANNYQNGRQTQTQAKRPADSDRMTGPKMQRINHVIQDKKREESYNSAAQTEAVDIEEEEQVNFLEKSQLCHGLADP